MKEKKIFLKCEHCSADVRDINMQNHLYYVHAIGEAQKEIEDEKESEEEPDGREVSIPIKKKMTYWFFCTSCNRKSLLTTGPIRLVYKNKKDDDPEFLYHREIKCKHCDRKQVEMEQMEKLGILVRKGTETGEDLFDEKVDVTMGDKTLVNEKLMRYEEVIPYLEKELSLNSGNWEMWLRYGNAMASMRNDYEKAIEAWKKAAELNPKAIAPYFRLGETFFNRWKTYNEKGARQEARTYLARALETITEKGDTATIHSDIRNAADHLVGMLTEIGFGDTGIYSAPMSEVEKPLVNHTFRQEKNENPIVRMSASERAGGIVENAIIGLLYECPDLTRESFASELKGLSNDFDGRKNRTGERLRQLIKLNLIHEKEKKNKLYTEPEIFLGMMFIADLLKEKRYFEKLKEGSRKAGINR